MKKLILAFRIFIFLLVSFKITLAQNETSIYFYEEGKEINDIKKGKWVEYYESGSLLAKGKYVYGKKSGTWKEYFENGCVKAKGNYVDGKKQGKWTEYSIYAYSEDYSRIAKGNYIDGKKHGEWIEYYLAYEYYLNKTRTIRYPPVNINYVEGKKQGEVINFFENGKISSKVNYVDGKEQGESIEFYENGKIKRKEYYLNGKLQGDVLTYYDDENIMRKEKYEDGKEQGEALKYYKNDHIMEKVNFVDGKKQGESIEYYENGKIKRKSNFIDGNKQGEVLTYSETGQTIAKVNYVDGKMQGEAFEYSQNGQISVKVNYVDGKMQGEWLNYHFTGQVSVKGNYKDGKKHGEWVYFSEKGQKIATETWNLGESNGDWNNVYLGSVKDIEGNEYPVVNYRGYTYMSENLKVKKMSNGDNIIESKNAKEWKENCAKSLPTYIINKDYPELGPMYNGYAVYDKRGLFPNAYTIIIDSVFYEAFWTLNETNRNCFENNFLGNTYVSTKIYNTDSQKSKAFYVKPDGKIYECPCKGGRWWMEETNFPHIDMSFSNSCSTGHDGTFFDDYPKPDWQSYGFYVRGFKKE